MKNFDVIIIGAGASGCMCALKTALKGKEILLIDRAKIAGKKLMATGNGRCNMTNLNLFPSSDFYNQNIDNFLNRHSHEDTLNFFNEMGLVCFADEEKRVYPISNSAKSVIDVLNNQLAKFKNISISLETEFEDIEFKNGIYEVITNVGAFSCRKLVIATGGNTAQKVLDKFKIKSKPFVPSLVALKTQSTKIVENIRISPAKVTLFLKDKKISEIGEILFKDNGISGIVAFNISSYFARNNNYNGKIEIDLLPNHTEEQIFDLLKLRKKLNLDINKMFDGIFLPNIGYLILNNCKLNENRKTAQLTDSEIILLAHTIKHLSFEVKSHYPNHQVYSGGVLIDSLTENLESIVRKGLYFCGEVCDVDGKCGGYNLQWAWTSGYIVGESI